MIYEIVRKSEVVCISEYQHVMGVAHLKYEHSLYRSTQMGDLYSWRSEQEIYIGQ